MGDVRKIKFKIFKPKENTYRILEEPKKFSYVPLILIDDHD